MEKLKNPKNEAVWTDAEREAWSLPKGQTVSDWADTYRYLDPMTSAEPGQWTTDRTPYLREIMDSFANPFIEEITMMASTQVGKTESLLNMLGYVIDQDPAPAMFVMAREEDAKSFSDDRIEPMITGSPQIVSHITGNSDDFTKQKIKLDRMILYMASANSPSSLASKPVRFLFMDETDKYPMFSGKEADPIKLATERTRTFWNRKIVKCSTPTVRGGYIFREYDRSDRRRYYLPCPHCSAYQVMLMKQIKWPEATEYASIKEKKLAWYECIECGGVIKDIDKQRMLKKGVWCPDGFEIDKTGRITGDIPETSKRGYWINAIYSPWLTFSEIASEFLSSKDRPELLMNFVNSWLAEVWEEKSEETSEDQIKRLRIDYPAGSVPEKVFVLTAGVDSQKDYFMMDIRGWAPGEESFLIRSSRIESWDELETALFKTSYALSTGETMTVRLALIDSGYKTDEVYSFCKKWRERARAIKGVDTLSGIPYKLSKIERSPRTGKLIEGGVSLWRIDTNLFKDKLARMMNSSAEDPAKFHIYNDVDDSYIKQMSSEHKIVLRDKKTGRVREAWVKKGHSIRNEHWDCEVYNLVAGDMLHVSSVTTNSPGNLNIYQPNRKPVNRLQTSEDRQRWLQDRGKNWIGRK